MVAAQKISELYDQRVVCGCLQRVRRRRGGQSPAPAVTPDHRDVTGRQLANVYAQTLGTASPGLSCVARWLKRRRNAGCISDGSNSAFLWRCGTGRCKKESDGFAVRDLALQASASGEPHLGVCSRCQRPHHRLRHCKLNETSLQSDGFVGLSRKSDVSGTFALTANLCVMAVGCHCGDSAGL